MEFLEGGARRGGEVLIGGEGPVEVQEDLSGRWVGRCQALLTQLEPEQRRGTGYITQSTGARRRSYLGLTSLSGLTIKSRECCIV